MIKWKFFSVVKNVQDTKRKVFFLFPFIFPFSHFTFHFPVWAQTSRSKTNSQCVFFFCFSSPFLLFHSLFPFSPENGNKKFTPLSFPYGLECSGIFSNFSWALVFLMYLLGKLFGDYPWWEYACCWGLPAYKVIHFLDSQISEKKSLKV